MADYSILGGLAPRRSIGAYLPLGADQRNQLSSSVVKDGVMRQRGASVLRVMLIWTVPMVAFGAFVIGPSERVAACSCASFTDEEALQSADAAFTGTLVETPAGDADSSTDPRRFVFDVDEVFKGDVFARQSIADFAACALEIRGPGPFVVFARTKTAGIPSGAADGELYSDMCSGTRALASGALPASFGAASAPVPGTSPIGDSGSQRPIVQTATIAGALALLGAGCAFALHRRRQGAT